MDEKCTLNPERDCPGIVRANEVSNDMKMLSKELSDFRQSVANTHERFGSRIGKLETREEVREEQYKQIKERLLNITNDFSEFQKDHKESITELKRGNREILDILSPIKHKVESLTRLDSEVDEVKDIVFPLVHKVDVIEKLSGEVDEIKEKPAKRWDEMVGQIIAIVVAALIGVVIARIGL